MKVPALEIIRNEISEALKKKIQINLWEYAPRIRPYRLAPSIGACFTTPSRAYLNWKTTLRPWLNVRLTCFLCCYTNSHHHFSHALPVAKPFCGVKRGLLEDLPVFTAVNADNLLVQLWAQKLWIVRPFLKIPFHKLISFYIHFFFFRFRFLFAIVTGFTVLIFFMWKKIIAFIDATFAVAKRKP